MTLNISDSCVGTDEHRQRGAFLFPVSSGLSPTVGEDEGKRHSITTDREDVREEFSKKGGVPELEDAH